MVDIPHTIDPVQPYRPQEQPLRGKVAVITGASANMGAALARTLAQDGAPKLSCTIAAIARPSRRSGLFGRFRSPVATR